MQHRSVHSFFSFTASDPLLEKEGCPRSERAACVNLIIRRLPVYELSRESTLQGPNGELSGQGAHRFGGRKRIRESEESAYTYTARVHDDVPDNITAHLADWTLKTGSAGCGREERPVGPFRPDAILLQSSVNENREPRSELNAIPPRMMFKRDSNCDFRTHRPCPPGVFATVTASAISARPPPPLPPLPPPPPPLSGS